MRPASATEDERDALRALLAELGVPLFVPAHPRRALAVDEYAALIVSLLRSEDARLAHAVPCLLAANDGDLAASAVSRAYAALTPAEGSELGLRYRLARCLVASRAPYLALTFGRRPSLPPLPIEPIDVPDATELCGEKGLSFASESYCERGLPDLPGGSARQFDTWLDLLWSERRRRESA